MRVLRLDLPGGSVELHPFVTVVRGLAPAAREALLDALAALPKGRAATAGLLEAHGVLLDLDDASLDLLDLRQAAAVVLRAADLPGASADGRVREAERALADAEARADEARRAADRAARAVEGARAALEARRGGSDDAVDARRRDADELSAARAAAEHALDAAGASERTAAAAVRDAEVAVEAARTRREAATAAVQAAATALDAAAGRRDPIVAATLEAARGRLVAAEAAVAAARDADDRGTSPAAIEPLSDEDLEALRAERVAAAAAVLALDTTDPGPIRLALAQLEATVGVDTVPDPAALALADRWADLETDLAHVTAADPVGDDLAGGEHRAQAQARLAAAQHAVADAESALRGPTHDSASLGALEAAHAAVLAARDALDRRFGRRAAEQRLAAAEAAERELLDQLGFTTYSEYLMGVRNGIDPAAAQRLDATRAELRAAAEVARRLDAAVAVELRRAELLDQRRWLRATAVELLGEDPGADVAGALRRRRIPAALTGDHLGRLRAALEATGLVLGDEELPERTLVDLASVWLDEQERTASEREALERRVVELDGRLIEATRQRDAGNAASAPTPLAAALAAVDAARADVRAAEERAARNLEIEAEVEARRRALEAAGADEVVAVAAVADAEKAALDARLAERRAAEVAASAAASLERARRAEVAAVELVHDLEQQVASATTEALEEAVARATQERADADAEAAERSAEVDRARAALDAARRAAEAPDVDPDPVADVEDAEWFLLARLAAQRAVSYAGSVPLVLDDALTGYDAEQLRRLLARLERMAATVQVVLVTEDLTTAAWAESVGDERAAVVQPAGSA